RSAQIRVVPQLLLRRRQPVGAARIEERVQLLLQATLRRIVQAEQVAIDHGDGLLVDTGPWRVTIRGVSSCLRVLRLPPLSDGENKIPSPVKRPARDDARHV